MNRTQSPPAKVARGANSTDAVSAAGSNVFQFVKCIFILKNLFHLKKKRFFKKQNEKVASSNNIIKTRRTKTNTKKATSTEIFRVIEIEKI